MIDHHAPFDQGLILKFNLRIQIKFSFLDICPESACFLLKFKEAYQ